MEVITDLLPVKRGDPGCPVIPISIGMVDFPQALCDFGSSVNIMPRNLYVRVGRPFLNTSRAVIYASAAKISFYIKGRKKTFSFENKTTQILEQSRHEPRKRTNRRNRNNKFGPSQLRWSLQFKEVKIVDLSHRS